MQNAQSISLKSIKRRRELMKAQAEEDVEKAQTRALEAEAVVMATAKLERELNVKGGERDETFAARDG